MSNTQTNQDQPSSKDSMPNHNVAGNSADEESVTDQHDPSATPDVADPVGAIGGAVGEGNIDFDKMEEDANRSAEEYAARQMKVAADAEERKAAIRAQTSNIFKNVSEGEESQRANEAIAASAARSAAAANESETRKASIRAQTFGGNDEPSEFELATSGFSEVAEREIAASAAREAERNEVRDSRRMAIRRTVDIVARARLMEMEIQFKDVRKVRQGDMFIPQPQMTDQNKIVVLNALFSGEQEKPHRDHFRGRIVDQDGKIIDEFYPVTRWVEAFAAAGLKGVTLESARKVIKEYALDDERNDLIERIRHRLPEWDHVPRMKNKLIELFGEKDDEFHQNCSQYFWLSLYARVMFPGSLAPMMLSIFGPQGCGKSRFTQALCKIIMCDPEADTTPLNMAGDPLHFLRAITGRSIIANAGEMTGFTRGDLNKIKDFITRQSDSLHFKYEGELQQPRQWITVMDGNKLDGVFRDDTGERRIILWVCGRQEDEQGKIAYDPDFKVAQNHWDTLEDEVWQIMAECQRWFDENGEKKYEAFVSEVVQQVNAANEKVKAKGNGGISDPVVETFFANAFAATPMVWRETGVACSIPGTEKKTQFYDVPQGVIVYADTFIQTMDRVVGKQKVTSERTKAALFAFAELNGGIIGKFSGKRAGVLFCVGKDVTSVKKRGGRAEAVDQLIADDGSNCMLTGDDAIAALKKKFTDDDGSKAAANQADTKHEPF